MTQIRADKERFGRDGFVVIRGLVPANDLDWICEELRTLEHPKGDRLRNGRSFAVRDVFAVSESLLSFARSDALSGLASTLLGHAARPTKATLFDKHEDANWSLPLHQDLTITVQAKADVPGFGPWTEKAGVPHVRPPESILQSIVALRIHLDDCPEENGALYVVRASHIRGRLSSGELKLMMSAVEEEVVPAKAGDVLVMSPLLIHGSGKAKTPNRRRVLHIEYSCVDLPAPLQWPIWSSHSDNAVSQIAG